MLVLRVIFRRLFQIIGIYVDLHRLPLAISVIFHIAFISIGGFMFMGNDSVVVDCRHELLELYNGGLNALLPFYCTKHL